jgi:hypothetical protein
LPAAVLEPAIPANERPKTHASNRDDAGTGNIKNQAPEFHQKRIKLHILPPRKHNCLTFAGIKWYRCLGEQAPFVVLITDKMMWARCGGQGG